MALYTSSKHVPLVPLSAHTGGNDWEAGFCIFDGAVSTCGTAWCGRLPMVATTWCPSFGCNLPGIALSGPQHTNQLNGLWCRYPLDSMVISFVSWIYWNSFRQAGQTSALPLETPETHMDAKNISRQNHRFLDAWCGSLNCSNLDSAPLQWRRPSCRPSTLEDEANCPGQRCSSCKESCTNRQPLTTAIPVGATLVSVRHQSITLKEDLRSFHPSLDKRHLSKKFARVLTMYIHWLDHYSPIVPLRPRPLWKGKQQVMLLRTMTFVVLEVSFEPPPISVFGFLNDLSKQTLHEKIFQLMMTCRKKSYQLWNF